ncbi:FAD-dependent oxidoreductase [Pyramidobacter sp. C12-8]|uniref:FAD-dependent oxidoreductase n=1 Tax=Pyramidobacter sp. C12-8 TaxID=1943580 RepID=UPI00098EC3C5|nr:FAD-dependent oxidoreductase [Pyramidobacter sp. C12-8]OON88511.1 thioredoxin reductase [Pyramidobacter sp. C12-8]
MSVGENLYDVIVIGGGPAGLTAALYLARACYRVLVVEKEKFGGQITITSEVVNYPGVERASGADLTDRMRRQAESFGAEFLLAEVTAVEVDGDVRRVVTSRGVFECFGLLVATGAHPRTVGFEGELDFRGHGVAYCATCDGEFFTGKPVFVVGGGFAAAEESVFLTKYASHVTVLIRKDDFSCAKSAADEARRNEKITVLTNTSVESVSGDSVLRRLVYVNGKTGERTVFEPENGDTFGVFVFAGYSPSTELFRGVVDLDERGYVITDRQQKTSVDGVYAAGDVCIKNLRQVVTAVGDGALAATELEKYCAAMQKKTGLKPEVPHRRAAAHRPADSGRGESAPATAPQGDGLFSADMVQQLDALFAKMESPLILRLSLDERPVSRELENYMDALAALTDKLTVEKSATAGDGAPCVRVCRADGREAGIAFHGVPGGHEFTSFVLGLYNLAGPGQRIDDRTKTLIEKLDRDVHMTIMVSLTCTMCPELVTAAQRIASLNPRVSVDVYDLNHFPELREKYNVMSVPCYVVNDGQPMFGKKTVEELLAQL